VIRYVIDASVATEYLLRTSIGVKVADLLERALLVAPELIDVEVLSVLRRAVMQEKLQEQRALIALEDLMDWQFDRIPHATLLKQAWQYRHNVSAYDAFYVTVAHFFDAPLLTADGPLSRTPALGIVVQNIRQL
jgi:predicted nucleic acid-binding protein